MTANELPQDVQSSIWFLQEDELYEKVKPYALAFTPEIDIPRENIRRKEFSVPIKDIRGSIKDPSLQDNGFMVLQLQEKDTDIDWTDERNVKEAHYPQIVRDVENALPGVHCAVLHHQIRKRDPNFPVSSGKNYTFGQPLRAAHIDMVRSSAEQLLQERLEEPAMISRLLRSKWMIANVWHPLKGPNQDWPLALCDITSVDPKHDLEIADYVTPRSTREHCILYHRDSHRWYYLSRQKTDEALLFCQYDSQKTIASGVPHASFHNPYSRQVEPRESIEVVVVIYVD